MANNRMYLICVPCMVKEDTKIEDCRLRIAKYYPSTGWYDPKGELDKDLSSFFENHKHGTMFGEDFKIVYESVFGGFHKQKRGLLEALSAHVTKVQEGKGNDHESSGPDAAPEQG
jgi:hypothetical protein